MRFSLATVSLLACAALASCSGESTTSGGAASDGTSAAGGASAATGSMDDSIKALMAKPELADSSITVQHVLIAFQGAPRIQGVTRSKDEAKVLAEQVWKEALGGADFKALMKQHSNDGGPGEYPMTKAGRMQMVKGFGDVGFRLAVGEIGVAPWDQAASPFGWHIIKRVK
jgi:parvulin-like peptidyl-prolyl isomerase